MRAVWSDESRVQKYLDFEAALARAQAKLGIIPKNAAAEIVRHCDAKEIDMAKLKEATERIGYPVLPVVQQLVKLCKGDLGEWSHWGATTQDVTDTATVLQIREALALIEEEIDGICAALLANIHPVGMFFTSILFGGLRNGGLMIQMKTHVSSTLTMVVQSLVIILVIMKVFNLLPFWGRKKKHSKLKGKGS
jgi:hypothetical protein